MEKSARYVLIVDDEIDVTKVLKRELELWAGLKSLNLLCAQSARAGLDILEHYGDEVIIVVSDLNMPEMKGSDFLLEVKKNYPNIISILLTGFSDLQEITKLVKAGIFSFMVKPWEPEYLVAELQKAYEFGESKRKVLLLHKMLEEELRWAGEFQKAMLKPKLPSSSGVEFRVSYRPITSLYCGGDYYDVFFLSQDRYLLLIGDVAGHGVKAAFVTGILKAVIYSEYISKANTRYFSPGSFLTWLNERLNFEFRSSSSLIITFFAGVLDLKSLTFFYSNAGHNHPFILRKGKALELPVSGSAIGFTDSISYTEQTATITSGDILLLFTDGLLEVGCSEGREQLKPSRLFTNVAYGPDHHRRLLDAALEESMSTDFSDDVTIVTARVL